MSITKWVAGFDYSGDVIVAQCGCRRTKKQVILERPKDHEGQRALAIIGYRTRFDHETADKIFHDSVDDALDALHQRELTIVEGLEQKISAAQDRMNQIDDFGSQQ